MQFGASQVGPVLLVIGYLYRQRKAAEERAKAWDKRGEQVDHMLSSWDHVAWNLRLNGFELERQNEPENMRNRSMRDLLGDLMLMVSDNRADIAILDQEIERLNRMRNVSSQPPPEPAV